MTVHGWPVRRFNLYAACVAMAATVVMKPLWLSLGVTALVGFVVAWFMVWRWLARLDQQLDISLQAWLNAQLQGANDASHVRFLLIQASLGALIQAMWTLAAAGIVHVIHG